MIMFNASMIAATWSASFLVALAKYGYVGIAVGVLLESAGVPVPGETILIGAAFGAAHGVLWLPGIIAVATIASIVGDNFGFLLGRRLGREWVERHGHRVLLTAERMRSADAFFERYGPIAVALARFIAGVRVIAAFAAGTSRMSYTVFMRYNILGALAWSTLVSLGGYALGRGYAGVGQSLGHAGAILAVVVPLALLAAGLLVHHRRRIADQRIASISARSSTTQPHNSLSTIRAELSHVSLRWLAVLSTSAGAVVSFVAIAEEVSERDTTGFDAAVRAVVLEHQSSTLHAIFSALTWAGSSLTLSPIAIGIILLLWRRWGRARAATAVALSTVSILVMLALKAAFHRARPIGAAQFSDLGYSFPSGHSMNTMAIGTTLAYVLVREKLVPSWAFAVAIAFSVLVGISRVYLDVHWATDVLGGWAVGLAVGAACSLCYEWMRGRQDDAQKTRSRARNSKEQIRA